MEGLRVVEFYPCFDPEYIRMDIFNQVYQRASLRFICPKSSLRELDQIKLLSTQLILASRQ